MHYKSLLHVFWGLGVGGGVLKSFLGQLAAVINTHSNRKNRHLGLFALIALHFWETALLFHYYQGKFCLNIFPNLKNKQVNIKNLICPLFRYFDQNKVCLHF